MTGDRWRLTRHVDKGHVTCEGVTRPDRPHVQAPGCPQAGGRCCDSHCQGGGRTDGRKLSQLSGWSSRPPGHIDSALGYIDSSLIHIQESVLVHTADRAALQTAYNSILQTF